VPTIARTNSFHEPVSKAEHACILETCIKKVQSYGASSSCHKIENKSLFLFLKRKDYSKFLYASKAFFPLPFYVPTQHSSRNTVSLPGCQLFASPPQVILFMLMWHSLSAGAGGVARRAATESGGPAGSLSQVLNVLLILLVAPACSADDGMEGTPHSERKCEGERNGPLSEDVSVHLYMLLAFFRGCPLPPLCRLLSLSVCMHEDTRTYTHTSTCTHIPTMPSRGAVLVALSLRAFWSA